MSTAPAFPPDLHTSPFRGEQFLSTQFDNPRSLTPEQRLCWGILEDCFQARRFALRHPNNVKAQRQRQKDLDWIDGAPAAVEFSDLCTLLGLPEGAVKAAYLKLDGHRVRHKMSTFR